MKTIRSEWVHRLFAAIAVLGITGTVYADHCWQITLADNDCGTTETVYGLDCSYWAQGPSGQVEFVSCPSQPKYRVVAAEVHQCVGQMPSGDDGCNNCGTNVFAKRQYFKCIPNSCTVVEDGAPVPDPDTDPCCSAELSQVVCDTHPGEGQ